MRRALPLLTLIALLVLGGCLSAVGPGGPDSATPDATDTPTPVRTPTGECVVDEQQTVDPYRDDVEPSDLPHRPTNRSVSSVEAYVVGFEKAYARNQRLSRASTQVNTMVTLEAIEERDGTWVVDVVSRTNTWVQGTDTADGTPTEVHGDGARIHVRYHLTEDALYRLQLGYDETAEPGAYGRPVVCFD